ncbi:transposase [Candidatus Riflebacteria bacterium]
MALKYSRQITIGEHQIQRSIDPEHFLVKLAKMLNWEEIFDRLKPFYSTIGRQALAIRLMVGLHILKHFSRLSDRECVDRLRGDFYWMHFCKLDLEQLNNFKHLNSSSMTRFRKRVGDEGFSIVEDVIREALVKRKRINPKIMNMDTSVQENNIAYPTDSGLLDKGRKIMLGLLKKFNSFGVETSVKIRSYNRVCKKILLNMIKLGKDRMDRIKEGTIELSKKANYVLKKLSLFIDLGERKLKKLKEKGLDEAKKFNRLIVDARHYRNLVANVIYQSTVRFSDYHVKNKIYSLHETQTVAISKGKRPKTHEYGCKFNISTDSNGFIVSDEVSFKNKSDKNFVEPALKNWEDKDRATSQSNEC